MILQTVRNFVKNKIGTDMLMVQEYTYFLDWILTLGMFIPCDDRNVPIFKPEKKFKNPHSEGLVGSYHCKFCGYTSALTPSAITHECVYTEYQKRVDLLVFNGFELVEADPTESTVEIWNKELEVGLLFNIQTGEVWDVTVDGLEIPIKSVNDLMQFKLELKYSW